MENSNSSTDTWSKDGFPDSDEDSYRIVNFKDPKTLSQKNICCPKPKTFTCHSCPEGDIWCPDDNACYHGIVPKSSNCYEDVLNNPQDFDTHKCGKKLELKKLLPESSCTAGNHDDGSKYYYKIEPVDKTTKTTVEPVDNFCCYDLPETNKC